jgi:hypothetical protein
MPYKVGLRRRLVSFPAGFPRRRSSRASFELEQRRLDDKAGPHLSDQR